jgi:hypothetical protein
MVSFAKLLRIRQGIEKKYKNIGLEKFLLSIFLNLLRLGGVSLLVSSEILLQKLLSDFFWWELLNGSQIILKICLSFKLI